MANAFESKLSKDRSGLFLRERVEGTSFKLMPGGSGKHNKQFGKPSYLDY